MNTIVLFIEDPKCWSPEGWMIQHGGIVGSTGQVVMETPAGWLSVLRYDDVIYDYDDFEKVALSAFIDHPIPFLIEWRGDELVQQFIAAVPTDCKVVVDNDHGLICLLACVATLPLASWINAKELK